MYTRSTQDLPECRKKAADPGESYADLLDQLVVLSLQLGDLRREGGDSRGLLGLEAACCLAGPSSHALRHPSPS